MCAQHLLQPLSCRQPYLNTSAICQPFTLLTDTNIQHPTSRDLFSRTASPPPSSRRNIPRPSTFHRRLSLCLSLSDDPTTPRATPHTASRVSYHLALSIRKRSPTSTLPVISPPGAQDAQITPAAVCDDTGNSSNSRARTSPTLTHDNNSDAAERQRSFMV